MMVLVCLAIECVTLARSVLLQPLLGVLCLRIVLQRRACVTLLSVHLLCQLSARKMVDVLNPSWIAYIEKLFCVLLSNLTSVLLVFVLLYVTCVLCRARTFTPLLTTPILLANNPTAHLDISNNNQQDTIANTNVLMVLVDNPKTTVYCLMVAPTPNNLIYVRMETVCLVITNVITNRK